ncbi:protein-export chaperone SecB [Flavobacterium sp.]|uniref:protein-export chaperone SecB n=1 Tax=Flavobacterium sp. TaxID=239 RepID=UPI00391AED88
MALSKFQFQGYKILKSVIELNEESINENQGLSLSFKTSGVVKKAENSFKLKLGVKINNSNNTVNIEIDAIGNFIFEPAEDNNDISSFFYNNASALLFPYLRAYISTLTNLSGLKPITLPTMNLSNLSDELKQNTVFLD